ncbi:MAG: dihydrodipicolinate synthase family protein [Verrucomicrobiota bacterium]|nr:dihydrodipicolinate synthase family protein [Verrucomicrobiota bacterium]
MAPLTGIYVPNLIPYDEQSRINEGELRRIISWLIENGVHGLYPNGSTGEFIRLSFEERLRVVEIIASETRGRVPILAGAAEANIDLVLQACKRYADLGCRAVSLTGPYYFKVSQDSIEHYFREIARQSPVDILVYNIPQFANEISLPVLNRLAQDCPRIIGTKDSSRDFPRFVNTLHQIKSQRPDFVVFTGTEEILLPSLMMGADGGTIATAGVVPEAILAIYNDFQSGNIANAKRIQFELLEVIGIMLTTGNFPDGFRAAAALRGFNFGKPRQTVSPREAESIALVRTKLACLLAASGVSEAATVCAAGGVQRTTVDSIVREVMRTLGTVK